MESHKILSTSALAPCYEQHDLWDLMVQLCVHMHGLWWLKRIKWAIPAKAFCLTLKWQVLQGWIFFSLNSSEKTRNWHGTSQSWAKIKLKVKLQSILLIKAKQFVVSVLINSNIMQQDGILEANFPTTTSPLHLQRYLDFIQALKVTAAFVVELHFPFSFFFFPLEEAFYPPPSWLSLKSDLLTLYFHFLQ